MRKAATLFLILAGAAGLQALSPLASLANDGGDAQPSSPQEGQEGEDRWVPSLAITAGALIQEQRGSAFSYRFEDTDPDPLPLRGCPDFEPLLDDIGDCLVSATDRGVAPFVGGSLELMTPALPIPTRPRLFLSGEILPSFESDRSVASEGKPSCFKGPEAIVPCARDEQPGERTNDIFDETAANGVGTRTISRVDTLVFGARLGVAWPFRIGKRQLRIKPSVGWIHYEVEAEGLVVDGSCEPTSRCTKTYTTAGDLRDYGYFRERILEASASKKFQGIGPGLDLEMDTGRFGPIGTSLFLGGGAYRILGDRNFSFRATAQFDAVRRESGDPLYDPDDTWEENPSAFQFGPETDFADFQVEVDPWMFRAHVGIRFQWLGSRK